jgi:hypothetical protein
LLQVEQGGRVVPLVVSAQDFRFTTTLLEGAEEEQLKEDAAVN